MNFSQRGWLTNQPTDWLICMAGWLADWLTDLNRVTNWLTDLASQIDGLANSLTEEINWHTERFWLTKLLTNWQTDWMTGWLADRLATDSRTYTDQLPGNCLTELMELSWRDPFNQNSNRSDREKWSTSKGGPETFPVGPNRSIEFWTEISGNFGWMDRAQCLCRSLSY